MKLKVDWLGVQFLMPQAVVTKPLQMQTKDFLIIISDNNDLQVPSKVNSAWLSAILRTITSIENCCRLKSSIASTVTWKCLHRVQMRTYLFFTERWLLNLFAHQKHPLCPCMLSKRDNGGSSTWHMCSRWLSQVWSNSRGRHPKLKLYHQSANWVRIQIAICKSNAQDRT